MRLLLIGLAAGAGLIMGTPALAGPQTASGFWNDPYHRTVDQQALDLAIAEAQLRARNDGYGAGLSTTNIGTYNSTSNYNGETTQNSSGATNVVNSNSTSVSTSSSSGLNLSIVTGQTSGSASQQAGSQVNTNTGLVGGISQGPNQ